MSVPVAESPERVRELAAAAGSLEQLDAECSVCRACPRLVRWREEVAAARRAAFAQEAYWGRPIPGWGPADARVAVVGLAPAAHGGNRTGRIFTGDRSGDFLFAGLHRAGMAALPTSLYAGDGQRLIGTRMIAAVRCAPPANKPTPAERDTCRPWLERELALLPALRVVVALGGFAWAALWPALSALGLRLPQPRPAFGHGAEVDVGGIALLGCYHPSQQNTFTGRLTSTMLDDVLNRAAALSGAPAAAVGAEPTAVTAAAVAAAAPARPGAVGSEVPGV